MPAEESLRQKLLRAAAECLLAVEGCAPTEAPEPAVMSDGAWEVRVLAIRVGTGQAVEPGTGQAVGGEIADLIRATLARAERPLKISQLASRLRRGTTNHFRDVVRRLVLAGEVRHLENPHRYWLSSRPLPEGQ